MENWEREVHSQFSAGLQPPGERRRDVAHGRATETLADRFDELAVVIGAMHARPNDGRLRAPANRAAAGPRNQQPGANECERGIATLEKRPVEPEQCLGSRQSREIAEVCGHERMATGPAG